MNIPDMLTALVRREGPYSHLKADRGGATKFGITQTTLAAWRERAVTVQDVKELEEDEAKAIYLALYYNRPHISALPDPLDDVVFDWGVNSGPGIAIKALQEVLGVSADGVIGPATLAAAHITVLHDTINALVGKRVMMIGRIVRRDPSQLGFLQGWLARCLEFIV